MERALTVRRCFTIREPCSGLAQRWKTRILQHAGVPPRAYTLVPVPVSHCSALERLILSVQRQPVFASFSSVYHFSEQL